MIDRYLERGDMFVLDDCGVKAECVVTREGEGVYELKNITFFRILQRFTQTFDLFFQTFNYTIFCL